jgi:predicted transcriptional regulator
VEAQAFEKTHERITLWLDKKLKEQFEQLADEEGISKTALLNEAVADVLKKHSK